jgi:hypothetical protein
LKRLSKLVSSANIDEVSGIPLLGDQTRPSRIRKRLFPGIYVGIEAIWIRAALG